MELPRPTTAATRDLSGESADTSAGAATFSHALHTEDNGVETRPCVCGGLVMAHPDAPGKGVRAHQFSPRHKAWHASHDFDGPYPRAGA